MKGVMPSEFVAHASIDSREIMKACQSLSALWLDRECPIKLSLSEGKVTLQAKEDRGEAVILADTSGQAEIAVNASFLMQALKATGGMVEMSIKDAATPVLFSAEDFKVLVTPIVWTEPKPVTVDEVTGKEAVEKASVASAKNDVAAKSTASTKDIARNVVAEAEAVVDKAAKKAKSAKTEKSKDKQQAKRQAERSCSRKSQRALVKLADTEVQANMTKPKNKAARGL